MTTPRIEILAEKKLVGKRINMSLAQNKTVQLWQSFMPRRKEIKNNLKPELFSMQVYNHALNLGDFKQRFDKWAAIEVTGFEMIPDGMDTFVLTGGLYAVFTYQGSSSDTTIFQYIFKNWLPSSNYTLDNRPHFEILGEKYKNNDPSSEEEIWIPIKPKQQ